MGLGGLFKTFTLLFTWSVFLFAAGYRWLYTTAGDTQQEITITE